MWLEVEQAQVTFGKGETTLSFCGTQEKGPVLHNEVNIPGFFLVFMLERLIRCMEQAPGPPDGCAVNV